jgi:hypothetical protein
MTARLDDKTGALISETALQTRAAAQYVPKRT